MREELPQPQGHSSLSSGAPFCRSRGVKGKDAGLPWLVSHVEAIHSSLAESQHLLLNVQALLDLLLCMLGEDAVQLAACPEPQCLLFQPLQPWVLHIHDTLVI